MVTTQKDLICVSKLEISFLFSFLIWDCFEERKKKNKNKMGKNKCGGVVRLKLSNK